MRIWNLRTDANLRKACEEADNPIGADTVGEMADLLRRLDNSPPHRRDIKRQQKGSSMQTLSVSTHLNELRAIISIFPRDFDGVRGLLNLGMLWNEMSEQPHSAFEFRRHGGFVMWLDVRERLDRALGQLRSREDQARRLLLLVALVRNLPKWMEGVWMARGHHDTAKEAECLKANLLVLDFDGVQDLSRCTSHDAMQDLLELSGLDPRANKRKVKRDADQLWRFRHVIRPGDLVTLSPRQKDSPITLGRVWGPYEYREVDGEALHARRVEWLRKLEREAFSRNLQRNFDGLDAVWPLDVSRAQEVRSRFFDRLEPSLRRLGGSSCPADATELP